MTAALACYRFRELLFGFTALTIQDTFGKYLVEILCNGINRRIHEISG